MPRDAVGLRYAQGSAAGLVWDASWSPRRSRRLADAMLISPRSVTTRLRTQRLQDLGPLNDVVRAEKQHVKWVHNQIQGPICRCLFHSNFLIIFFSISSVVLFGVLFCAALACPVRIRHHACCLGGGARTPAQNVRGHNGRHDIGLGGAHARRSAGRRRGAADRGCARGRVRAAPQVVAAQVRAGHAGVAQPDAATRDADSEDDGQPVAVGRLDHPRGLVAPGAQLHREGVRGGAGARRRERRAPEEPGGSPLGRPGGGYAP
mmetsp:Transcript_31568/g.83385  ORF Transcript_31568/g.83385 Transcript_31568/m.83385 type:complete len:262 (+) Transcript_31568:508-1293(+)